MKRKLFFLVVCAFITLSSNAQDFSVSVMLGYASPQGSTFSYDEGTGGAFGLTYSADFLYYLPKFEKQLGVGVAYNGSLLAGAGQSGSFFDLDLYSLGFYGVKGQYRFFKSKVSPYAAFATGLSFLTTPEVYSEDGTVLVEGQRSASLGLLPEVGVEFGNFKIAALYLVPMKYATWDSDKESAGALQFVLGYKVPFNF